jgi:hypothetical protein
LRAALQFALEVEGFRVDTFASGEELFRRQCDYNRHRHLPLDGLAKSALCQC